jgi:hypothetical protein
MITLPLNPVHGEIADVSDTLNEIYGSFIYDAPTNCWFPYIVPNAAYVPFVVVTTYKVLTLSEGPIQSITLTASTACEISTPLPVYGGTFKLLVKQPSTGVGTVTWFGVVWSGGTIPTVTATAGRADLFTFTSDGSKWYADVKQNYIW